MMNGFQCDSDNFLILRITRRKGRKGNRSQNSHPGGIVKHTIPGTSNHHRLIRNSAILQESKLHGRPKPSGSRRRKPVRLDPGNQEVFQKRWKSLSGNIHLDRNRMGIGHPTGIENRLLRNRRRFCCLCPNGTDGGGLSGERLLLQQTLDCFVVNDDLSFMRFFDLPFFEH